MCELMAMSFAGPISADFSIREFAARGVENPDGWGLAWYPDRAAMIVKEPIEWGTSTYARFLASEVSLESSIHLAHVRHKTVGAAPAFADTHPFGREWGGRDYTFAHNGTLDDRVWDLPLAGRRPLGRTDSEHFFCHLMSQLENWGEPLDTPETWSRLFALISATNRLGKLNCLLSDGVRLFCYHDTGGWKGLNFRRVTIRDHQVRHFGDQEWSIGVESDAVNHGHVVATCPLSNSGWYTFLRGELIVFEGGRIVHSSHRPWLPDGVRAQDSAADRQELAGPIA